MSKSGLNDKLEWKQLIRLSLELLLVRALSFETQVKNNPSPDM